MIYKSFLFQDMIAHWSVIFYFCPAFQYFHEKNMLVFFVILDKNINDRTSVHRSKNSLISQGRRDLCFETCVEGSNVLPG